MGLGRLFNRDVQYTATDTKTGTSQTWTVVDNIAPDWSRGDYRGGMGLPGAWRCALLLSDLLGAVPWHAYRERAGGPAERMTPTPTILDQPAPPDTRVTTFSSLVLDLVWHGNGIALVASRNREGWPTSYVPVRATDVQVKRVGTYDNAALPVGTVAYLIGGRWYPSDDVLHVKGPCAPGSLRGMSILENHLNGTLALAEEQSRMARSVSNAGVPSGVLTVEDTPEEPLLPGEAAEVKAGWMRSQRERSVAVLNARTKFEALAWDPTEAQLLDARKYSLHETALLFGLDPSWLGVSGSSMTYQNVEQKGLELVKYTLTGHLARIEQALTLHLPRGTWAKANLDAILRADTKTRYETHKIALDAGFLDLDEVRALEDRPPLTPAQREARRPVPRPAEPDPNSTEDEEVTPDGA